MNGINQAPGARPRATLPAAAPTASAEAIERYAMGLLCEESGELTEAAIIRLESGRGDRQDAQAKLNGEAGDMLAAIRYGCARRLLSRTRIMTRVSYSAATATAAKDPEEALFSLARTAGRMAQLVGKGIRFEVDSPFSGGETVRERLQQASAELMVAIERAGHAGVIDGDVVSRHADAKLLKLLDPTSRDNLGRRLAP